MSLFNSKNFSFTCIYCEFRALVIRIYMENVYSTLALEKEREIVKEETALRKKKEAVCCYAVQGCIQSYIYIGSRDGLENHMHTYVYMRTCTLYIHVRIYIVTYTYNVPLLYILPTMCTVSASHHRQMWSVH